MCRSLLKLLNRAPVVGNGCSAGTVGLGELDLVGIVGRQHVEVEHQPVGGVFDWLRETGFAPCLPESGERPMIDVDGDRLGGLGVDTDQADDGAEIDNAVDLYA